MITLDPAEAQTTPRKRRKPPAQFAGRVKELGDVMSSVSINEWGHNQLIVLDRHSGIGGLISYPKNYRLAFQGLERR